MTVYKGRQVSLDQDPEIIYCNTILNSALNLLVVEK